MSFCLALLMLAPQVARGDNKMTYPIEAEVLEVIDGDSIRVRAKIWLGLSQEVIVRLEGVDTPELRGKCQEEKDKAKQAKKFVEQWSAESTKISLHGVARGKFGGRVVAAVRNEAGEDLAGHLITQSLAHPYQGTTARGTWCPS